MPKRVGKTEEKPVEETKPTEAATETRDPVVEHLKTIGVLDAWFVAEDPISSPMSFYVAIVVPKRAKEKVPIPAIVKANKNSGYVRAMIPIPPSVLPKIEEALREAIVKCDAYRTKVAEMEKELKVKQLLAKLDKEEIEILKKALNNL